VNRLLGAFLILRDDHALARREAIGLEHHRKAEFAGANRIERLVERLTGTEARRWHAMPRHERFRECFAGFQPSRGSSRSEQQSAFSRKSIGDAQAQR
jgi:hypothetical protein